MSHFGLLDIINKYKENVIVNFLVIHTVKMVLQLDIESTFIHSVYIFGPILVLHICNSFYSRRNLKIFERMSKCDPL